MLERYSIRHPFILYAGTIRPQKNVPRLVEAFAVLRGEFENHPEYRDLRLVIIGDELVRISFRAARRDRHARRAFCSFPGIRSHWKP